ncbi:MAG: GTP-binding protein [Lachnospiraceae bacterium]|nr:GTP-binding protein [Lachnospiraceae bacterium]
MFERDIPIYVITGFLESGKTTFLNNTIHQDYFRIKGRTLLICCETGEMEYDPADLKRLNTAVEMITKAEDFNADTLKMLDKKHKPERVLVEYNPFWGLEKMYSVKLPRYWDWAQHIVIADASCFQAYMQTLMPVISDMLPNADLVVFNRANTEQPLANFRRSVKVVNGGAQVIFEGEDGDQINIFEDKMPFDIDADVIDIDDVDFGIWYVDVMDNFDRYIGKKVHFKGQVLKSRKLDADFFVPGRKAMTCCADDIQFIGYVCQTGKAPGLKEGEWVEVTGTVRSEMCQAYKEEGPVIHVEKLVKTTAPDDEMVYFT